MELQIALRRFSVPLLPVLIGVAAGILIGLADISAWWIFVACILAGCCYLYVNGILGITIMAVAIGWAACLVGKPDQLPDDICGRDVWCIGEVLSVDDGAEPSRRLLVSVGRCGTDTVAMPDCGRFKALFFVGSLFPAITPGDSVRLHARLSPPVNLDDIPYGNDYAGHLRARGIVASSFVSSADVEVIGRNHSVYWRLCGFRQSLSDLVLRSGLSSETAWFVNSVLLGDTSLLPDYTRGMFATSGMAHLLALSGMHVAIVALIVAVALFPLYILRFNRLRLILIVAVLWMYAVMTGMSPSVVRAVIMATLVMVGRMFHLNGSPLNNLCLAAILILLCDPMALVAPGFQLSFAAVAAILVISPALNPVDQRAHPFLYRMASWVAVCVAAVLGTGLLAAYYFHTYPLYFLLGNMVAVLLMPFVMGLSVILLAVEAMGFDPLWLCRMVDCLYGAIEWSAEFTSSLPGSAVGALYFPAWVLLPYAFSVVMLVIWLVKRRMVYGCGMIVALTITLVAIKLPDASLPLREYFITRNAYRTDIIVRDGTAAYMITTASYTDSVGVADEYMERYSGYFGRAGVNRIVGVGDSCDIGPVSRRGAMLAIGPDTYVVLDGSDGVPRPSGRMRIRYALVCRGYTGSMDGLESVADTVLLSRDLNARLHERYVRQLAEKRIPYRSLRDAGHHRVF